MKTLLILALLSVGGCQAAPSDAELATLTKGLKDDFPDKVLAISFENAPPLDPPTIFIDTVTGLSRADEVAWMCTLVKPRVDAIDARIDVESTQASLRSDCS